MTQTIKRLYEEDWWWDAVSNGQWECVKIEKGGKTIAKLPFVIKKERFGLKTITKPPLTQFQGPWLDLPDSKYPKAVENEISYMNQLIELLPSHDRLNLCLSPENTNWLAFHWKGYKQTTRYSYIIERGLNTEQVWENLSEQTRRNIRKAEKQIFVKKSDQTDGLFSLIDKTFERQKIKTPPIKKPILNLIKEGKKRDNFILLYAYDEQENLCASALFFMDTQCLYYISGGADPAFRKTQAQSLLLWEGIKYACQHDLDFDFEGSMEQGIELFFRRFGGKQRQFFQIHGNKTRKAKIISGLKEIYKSI